MSPALLPSARRTLTAPTGPGADIATGGDVVAPRSWWRRLRPVLRAIEDGTGAVFALAEDGADALMTITVDGEQRAEGYTLDVGDGRVRIGAATSTGAAYALQTLRQLLPPETFRRAGRGPAVVEPIALADAPAVAWRGVMVDVSRHFLGKTWLLRLLDVMALHKLNVLHLHLTDDQGWRLEVDAFPELTRIGAFRRETLSGGRFSETFDGRPHGGFLSKADVREIVAHADDLGITVVPEIDMPGHMLAAVASYPEWGVTGVQTEVLTRWGVSHDVLNLSDATVAAMCTILDEVMELFPAHHVHIGGDECPRSEWIESPRVQELIRERGLADEDALQHWFTGRLAEHVASRGRRLLGWDEVLGGGLPSNVTIMAWRDEDRIHDALALGHDVVVATQQHLYLDFRQSADESEPLGPRVFSYYLTDLQEVYEYAWPVADGVIGAQVCLWTEFVPTPAQAEYMLFPRTCAFAERAWSGSPDGFEQFVARLEEHLPRLDALAVGYRPLAGPRQEQASTWSGVVAAAPPRIAVSSNDSAPDAT